LQQRSALPNELKGKERHALMGQHRLRPSSEPERALGSLWPSCIVWYCHLLRSWIRSSWHFMGRGFLVVRLLPTDVQVHICSVDLILHPLISRCILGRPLERLVDSSDRPATWGTGQDIGSTQHREISTRVRQTESIRRWRGYLFLLPTSLQCSVMGGLRSSELSSTLTSLNPSSRL